MFVVKYEDTNRTLSSLRLTPWLEIVPMFQKSRQEVCQVLSTSIKTLVNVLLKELWWDEQSVNNFNLLTAQSDSDSLQSAGVYEDR